MAYVVVAAEGDRRVHLLDVDELVDNEHPGNAERGPGVEEVAGIVNGDVEELEHLQLLVLCASEGIGDGDLNIPGILSATTT